MKSFIYILVASSGYLGLGFYTLEYCEQKVKESNQYIARYLTIGVP